MLTVNSVTGRFQFIIQYHSSGKLMSNFVIGHGFPPAYCFHYWAYKLSVNASEPTGCCLSTSATSDVVLLLRSWTLVSFILETKNWMASWPKKKQVILDSFPSCRPQAWLVWTIPYWYGRTTQCANLDLPSFPYYMRWSNLRPFMWPSTHWNAWQLLEYMWCCYHCEAIFTVIWKCVKQMFQRECVIVVVFV